MSDVPRGDQLDDGASLFAVDVRSEPELVRVVVAGEVDLAAAEQVELAVDIALAMKPHNVVIDARDTTFADIGGARALQHACVRCASVDAHVALLPSRAVRRVLDLVAYEDGRLQRDDDAVCGPPSGVRRDPRGSEPPASEATAP